MKALKARSKSKKYRRRSRSSRYGTDRGSFQGLDKFSIIAVPDTFP
jgi:hypothetical protein